jgi:hypothetical protein
VKSAERSTKWCNLNDDETGVNAVQRLNMLLITLQAKCFYNTSVYFAAHGMRVVFKNE